MSSSNYSAPEYTPTPEVVATHSMYHVDPYTFQQVDNTFDPFNMTYLYSVVTVPAIILVIGLLMILLLFIISNCFTPSTCFWKYCWYYICCCFCCPPKEKPVDVAKLEQKKEEWLKRSGRAVKACYSIIFTIVTGACFLWMGNADLTKGMYDAMDAVSFLKETITNLFGYVNGNDSVISHTQKLVDAMGGQQCAGNTWYPQDLRDILNSMASSTQAIVDSGNAIDALAKPIDAGLGSLNDQIEAQIPVKDMYVQYVFIGLMALALLNFFTVWRKNPYISFVVSIVNYVLMIVLLLICSVSMIVVMLLADFCFDPAASLTTLAGSAADTVRYFTTCSGPNKFGDQIKSLQVQIDVLRDFIATPICTSPPTSIFCIERFLDNSNTTCYGNNECYPSAQCDSSRNCYDCSNALTPEFDYISARVGDVSDTLSCSTINQLYDKLINQAFCSSSFSGVYKVWGDLYFIALFLFILICCISKLYEFMVSDPETAQPWKKAHYKLVAAEIEGAHDSEAGQVEMTSQQNRVVEVDLNKNVVNVL